MTEPLTDAEWVQFALWAHRNPIVAEHAGTLRLMGALKAAMEQLAALEVVVRNQQFTIGGHEAIAREAIAIAERAGVVPYELVDRAAALGNRPTAADAAHWLSSALAALSIPPATDPPREAEDSKDAKRWRAFAESAELCTEGPHWDNGGIWFSGALVDMPYPRGDMPSPNEYADALIAMQAPQAQEAEGRRFRSELTGEWLVERPDGSVLPEAEGR
jgi:hypothetical protein